MFIPNVSCRVTPLTAARDSFGAPVFGASRSGRCSVVKLTGSTAKTSVRTDSSGSGGNADEFLYDAVLLFLKNETIKANDLVEIGGAKLKVISVQPRYDVMGKLDHKEVGLNIWV